MKRTARRTKGGCERGGLSLIEVVISTLLVSVVLLGAMDMLGAVTRDRTSTSEQIRGHLLAQRLMTEILGTAYVDGSLLGGLGLELGEATGNRSSFDDVDDYHLWAASPPQARSGAALPNSAGWREAVEVHFVSPADPSSLSLLDTGVKRITVTIQRNGRSVTRLVALRTDDY